jgi:hypothetical protein
MANMFKRYTEIEIITDKRIDVQIAICRGRKLFITLVFFAKLENEKHFHTIIVRDRKFNEILTRKEGINFTYEIRNSQ